MFATIMCVFLGSGGKKNVCKSCARKAAVQTLCKPTIVRFYTDAQSAVKVGV